MHRAQRFFREEFKPKEDCSLEKNIRLLANFLPVAKNLFLMSINIEEKLL